MLKPAPRLVLVPRRARRAVRPRTGPAQGVDELLSPVAAVLDPVAQSLAGQPARVVKPALRRAWRDAFDVELGEPALTWCAQAIQDRQPWSLVWRGHDRGRSGRPEPSRAPRRRLTATLDLPSNNWAAVTARRLLTEVLRAWGQSELAEDAALVTEAVVDQALDRAAGGMRLDITLVEGRLRVALTYDVSSRRATDRLTALRKGLRTRNLLAALPDRWASEEHHGATRMWAEFAVPPRASHDH